MKHFTTVLTLVLLAVGLVSIPALFGQGPSQQFPVSLYPTFDAAYDLGIVDVAGGNNFRWRNLYAASAVFLGATTIRAANAGELIMKSTTAGAGAVGAATAPGANTGMLRWEADTGANQGKCKLVAYAGASTTGVSVVTGVGSASAGGGCAQ